MSDTIPREVVVVMIPRGEEEVVVVVVGYLEVNMLP